MNRKGEISAATIGMTFVLLVVLAVYVNGVQPVVSALAYTYFTPGTFGRVLFDLIPLLIPIGIIFLLARSN